MPGSELGSASRDLGRGQVTVQVIGAGDVSVS